MIKNKSKARRRTPYPKPIDGEKLREYQEAELFKMKFQKSPQCKVFRAAWSIPINGFGNFQEYDDWRQNQRRLDFEYIKSEKFKKRREDLIKKRKAWAENKIRKSDLEFAERDFSLFYPSAKYNFDLELVVVWRARKPLYWKNFIENCLLFHQVEPTLIMRPIPEPRLEWSNDLQRYELRIENIFSDTTTKDFDNPEFTQKLKKLQKKLSGYGPRPRSKKGFGVGLKVLELDKDHSLRDSEKADKIDGLNEIPSFGPREDQKRKNRIKTMRHRMKKRLGT